MYDMIIKAGEVIDPAQGIRGVTDIAILEGKIGKIGKDIDSSQAREVVNARAKIVTPGLIDFHAHVYENVTFLGVGPDVVGVRSGVTTVVDPGSAGYATFAGFRSYIVPSARTRVVCFLNIASTGMCLMPELRHWKDIDLEETMRVVAENRDLVKGIKIRLVGPLVKEKGLEVFLMAKRAAEETKVSLMVHIGDQEAEPGERVALTKKVLPLLRKGDIITHFYTERPGGVIGSDGKVLSEFKDAIDRGVLLDVGHGRNNFSFKIARLGLEQGIFPFTISTDLVVKSLSGPVYSQSVTMSKFLNLGVALERVIEMTTINPARALDMEDSLGSLKVGMPADITVAELAEGDWEFEDSMSRFRRGSLLFRPVMTIRDGKSILMESIST